MTYGMAYRMKLDGGVEEGHPFVLTGALIGTTLIYQLVFSLHPELYQIGWISAGWFWSVSGIVFIGELVSVIRQHKMRIARFTLINGGLHGRVIENGIDKFQFEVAQVAYWWSYAHGWPVNAKRPAPRPVEYAPGSDDGSGGGGPPANSLALCVWLQSTEQEDFVFTESLGPWSEEPALWPYRPEHYAPDERVFVGEELTELIDWLRLFGDKTGGSTYEFVEHPELKNWAIAKG